MSTYKGLSKLCARSVKPQNIIIIGIGFYTYVFIYILDILLIIYIYHSIYWYILTKGTWTVSPSSLCILSKFVLIKYLGQFSNLFNYKQLT